MFGVANQRGIRGSPAAAQRASAEYSCGRTRGPGISRKRFVGITKGAGNDYC